MASTAELLINITANASSAIGALGEVQGQTRALEGAVASAGTVAQTTAAKAEVSSGMFGALGEQFASIGKMAVGMATGMLAANVSMGIAERITSAAEEIDTYGKAVLRVQRITGESAQSSSLLVAMFERFSPSLDVAIGKLTRFEAVLAGQEDIAGITATGGKNATAMLADFGVQATDSNGKLKPTIDILYQLADGFKNSDDAAAKALAMRTFFGQARGAGGDAMLLMLNQGSDGLKAMAAAADKYGLTLTGENLTDVQAFVFAHKDLDMALQGVSLQLGAAFMPAITSAAQKTVEFAQALNTTVMPAIKALGESPATTALLGISSGMIVLAAAAKIVSVVVTPLTAMFATVGAAIYTFSQPLRDSIDTLYKLKAAYNSLPDEAFNTPVLGGAAAKARDRARQVRSRAAKNDR